MNSEFRNGNYSAWGSLGSSNKSNAHKESDYPILCEIGKHLCEVHSSSMEGGIVDSLASGLVLCDIVFDYMNSEFIGDYHRDAKRGSTQAEQNFSAFGAACEKLQIPHSCIVTFNDFKSGNLKKIEFTLVLFVIRGMAYGLPSVNEELAEKLRNYDFDNYPEKERDLAICKKILSIYRDEENNKDIPVEIPESESDSSEDKQMDDMRPEEEKSDDMRPEEESSEDVDMRPEEDVVADFRPEEEKPVMPEEEKAEEVKPEELKEEKPEELKQEPLEEIDDEVDEVPEIPAESEAYSVNTGTGSLPVPVGIVVPEIPMEEEAPADPIAEDDEVDEAKEEDLPIEEIPSTIIPEEDKVDEVVDAISDSDTESVSEEEDDTKRQGPRVVVIPREPEVITQSNDPVGFDVDPHETEEERVQREEEARRKKEEKEKRKKEKEEALVPMPSKDISFAHKTDDIKNIIGKPQKRAVKWYVVALFIVLMLICLVCSIICGVFLAKINN